jgi:hypothetical protein
VSLVKGKKGNADRIKESKVLKRTPGIHALNGLLISARLYRNNGIPMDNAIEMN